MNAEQHRVIVEAVGEGLGVDDASALARLSAAELRSILKEGSRDIERGDETQAASLLRDVREASAEFRLRATRRVASAADTDDRSATAYLRLVERGDSFEHETEEGPKFGTLIAADPAARALSSALLLRLARIGGDESVTDRPDIFGDYTKALRPLVFEGASG